MNIKTQLRERAEEVLDTRPSPSPSPREAAEHELHVHQIELEMQNEALRQSQFDLEASRDRYFDLYRHRNVFRQNAH
jgi:hypothetical protein